MFLHDILSILSLIDSSSQIIGASLVQNDSWVREGRKRKEFQKRARESAFKIAGLFAPLYTEKNPISVHARIFIAGGS